MLASQVSRLCPSLILLQHRDNPLFRAPCSLHLEIRSGRRTARGPRLLPESESTIALLWRRRTNAWRGWASPARGEMLGKLGRERAHVTVRHRAHDCLA